jgi:hypothetical protein
MKGDHTLVSVRIAVAAVATLLACTSLRPTVVMVTPVGSERTYPATPDSAAIPLYTITTLGCPYDEIAALTAEGRVDSSSEAEILSLLKAKARAIGAHAIIGYTQSTRHGTELEGDIRVRNGTAIRFRSAECTK